MYVDDLAGKGLELKVLAELLFQFSLTFVPLSLPLAILLASLMTFGNLGEFLELTALKSSGIPLQRIMMPCLRFASLLAVGSFFFADYVLPIQHAGKNPAHRYTPHASRTEYPGGNLLQLSTASALKSLTKTPKQTASTGSISMITVKE